MRWLLALLRRAVFLYREYDNRKFIMMRYINGVSSD